MFDRAKKDRKKDKMSDPKSNKIFGGKITFL